MILEGRVARVHIPGDALMYATGPEHRDVSEVDNIVAQLPKLNVYLGHPSVYPASKSKQPAIGYVESGRLDEDTAVARIIVTDAEALEAIQAGTKELSLGYKCVLDADRYQRSIQLDHLAVVDRARCSAQCSLRVDSIEVPLADNPDEVSVVRVDTIEVPLAEEPMKVAELEVPVTIALTDESKALLEALSTLQAKQDCGCGGAPDGKVEQPASNCTCKNHAIVHNNGEPMSDLNNELQGKLDAALAEIEALKGKVTTLEVESVNARKDAEAATGKLEAAAQALEAAKAEAAVLVAKAKADADEAIAKELQARVDARVGLLVEAAAVLKDVDFKNMSDRDIKCAVIKHVDGDEVAAEKSMDYVTGVYEGALKRASKAGESRESTRVAITEMRKDNAPLTGIDAERAAKEKMHRESNAAWAK